MATLSNNTISYAKDNYDASKTKDDLYKIMNDKNLVNNARSKEEGLYRFTEVKRIDSNTYSTTTVDVVSTDLNFLDIVEENSVSTSALGGGSNYKDKYDNAVSNMAYTTVNYQETSSGNNSYCAVTSVSGGYINSDSTCKVISQNLQFGQSSDNVNYVATKTPSGTSWSYTAPSTWSPVKTNVTVGCYVGAVYTLTIQRYSTPWTLELDNYIYSVPGSIWP